MHHDLGCNQVGKMYVKMEEDVYISTLVRLRTKTIIKCARAQSISQLVDAR